MVGNLFLVTFFVFFILSPLFFIDLELICVDADNIRKKLTAFGNVDFGVCLSIGI